MADIFEKFTEANLVKFMQVAIDGGRDSHDWRTQAGNVIINPNKFVPERENYEECVMGRGAVRLKNWKPLTDEEKAKIIASNDYRYSCMDHGEPVSILDALLKISGQKVDKAAQSRMDAILALLSEGYSLKGHIMFLDWFPCNPCAEIIGKSGISGLAYSDETVGVGYNTGTDYGFQNVFATLEKYGVQTRLVPMRDEHGNPMMLPLKYQSKHYKSYYDSPEFRDSIANKNTK